MRIMEPSFTNIPAPPNSEPPVLMLPCDTCDRLINTDHEDFWWCEICDVAYCCGKCIGCLCGGLEQR